MNIVVNGTSYDSWDAVPAEIRAQVAEAGLPDADGNGVPDLFEGKGGLPAGATTSTVVEVDGQKVSSLDELSPAIREALQTSLGGLLGGQPATVVTPGAPTSAPTGAPARTPSLEAPGTPAPGEVVLNGETVTADGAPAKKGFFKRLFG